jgi:hypothetical protein
MSRFESSTFIRNPQVMNTKVLKIACDKLGWEYVVKNNELIVKDVNQNLSLYGEYALILNLLTNEVTYNTYYLPDAHKKVEELQVQFYALNAEYAKNTLIETFREKGFTYKSNSRFIPTNEEVYSFFMVGRSKDKNEDEPIGQIKFIILKDGTIVTDSDYLPNDVNELAHDAMDKLELDLGNKRIMTKREIPQKYLHKVKPRNLNTLNNSNNE